MNSNWTIELIIREKRGSRVYRMAQNLDLETFGERLADDMRAGLAFAGPNAFGQTVTVLKQREFRRDLLVAAAELLARRMGDHLEDREGWHGRDRQKALQAAERKRG